ncbi:MAG TPA: hypothetical protein VIP98_16700 [Microlunatus sp.]
MTERDRLDWDVIVDAMDRAGATTKINAALDELAAERARPKAVPRLGEMTMVDRGRANGRVSKSAAEQRRRPSKRQQQKGMRM